MTTDAAQNSGSQKLEKADRDLIALGIAFAAILMFVGTGSSVLPKIVSAWSGKGVGPDQLLTNALLLNIALVIFGWRRYRQLNFEVRERRQAEEQARILAETDPLTGCLNRRSIGEMTDKLLATATSGLKSVAFVMLDLDNFKQVNDVHGHAAGDALLCETARRIRTILPEGSLLARIGGDEFACVVPFDASAPDPLAAFASELVGKVSQPLNFNSISLETTVSAGMSRSDCCEGAPNAQTLLHTADIAMYHAKSQGKNRSFWFEPSMESELRFRSELEAGVRRAIKQNEFVPYYEKQVDTETGEISGFEVLARWNSPTLGLVSPEIFIPIAEEIGVIAELSEGLIRQALLDARGWHPRLTLSVNISPVQLRDPWFAQKLLKMLVETNFPPSRLELEVTESCLHGNIGQVRSLILSLKNQGIRISLDDFGTGYSSLSQLQSLPFDRIKIDRSFVSTLPGNKDSATIVQSIASLGAGLGLPITAEGVESEEVLHELRRFGSFKVQGYLYGRPESAERTEKELSQLDLLLVQSEFGKGEMPIAPPRRLVSKR